MHYVYVLQSKIDKNFYIGCTHNLRNRLKLRNEGKVTSTAKRKPFSIIFYEAFMNQKDAFSREKFLKTGWGKNQLHRLLSNFLLDKKLGG